MNVRETLRERPSIGIAITAVAVLISVAMAWSALRPSQPANPMMPSSLYFSDDDGRTYFVDDSALISGFDHGGKTAYQAAVFRCGQGAPFVGYLITFTPGVKAQLSAMSEGQRRSSDPSVIRARLSGSMVNRAGDNKWQSLDANVPVSQILVPACADGSAQRPEQILP